MAGTQIHRVVGQANHLKDKNNSAINSLTKEDQNSLWEAVKTRK